MIFFILYFNYLFIHLLFIYLFVYFVENKGLHKMGALVPRFTTRRKDLSHFQWKSAHAPKKELPQDFL